MSIIDPPRRYTLVTKARPDWDENAHPRDRLGRFIETGAEVRVWGGQGGRVVRNVGGGRIEIVRADGSHAVVHRNYLTVTKRPDGSAPTAQQAPDVAELPEQEPEKPDAEEVEIPDEPTPGGDAVRDQGSALADAIPDETLAAEVRERTAAYHEAVTNNVPDDEADERAALRETLDRVQTSGGGDTEVDELAAAVWNAAAAEPAVAPARPDAPDDVPDAPQAPAGPSIADQVRQNRGQTINAIMANGDTITGQVVGVGDGSIDIQRTTGGIDRVREDDIERIDRAIPPAPEGHGTIENPDDPSGSPTYDGPLDQAHTRLDPGTYDASDENGNPVTVTVTDDSSTVSPREPEAAPRGVGRNPETPPPPPMPAPREAPTTEPSPPAPLTIDAVKAKLREFAASLPTDGRVAATLARNARGIDRTRNENLRLSPAGGVIARRDPSGGWVPYAVGDAQRLSAPSVRFTDDEIEDALRRYDELGIPFGDHDAMTARWNDGDQRVQDLTAVRALGTDVVAAREADVQTFTVPRGRWRDVEQVRQHLATSSNTSVQAIAADPLSELSASGRLLAHRDVEGQRGWRVATTHGGKRLDPRLFGTRAEALEFADTLERNAIDKDGQAYPFDGALGERRLRTWRNAQGDALFQIVADASKAVAPQNPDPADFTDAWYQERARDAVDLPTELASLSDSELADRLTEAIRIGDGAARNRIYAERSRREDARREAEMTRELTPEERLVLVASQADGNYLLVERNVRDMFSFTSGNGWTTDWESVSNDRADFSEIKGLILDANGNQVGTVTRSVGRNPDGTIEVHHGYLSIDPQHQGQGFADAYYKHLEAEYEARGVDYVTITANIDVGGYAWAQRGFDWDTDHGEPTDKFVNGFDVGRTHYRGALENIDAIDTSAMSAEDRARIARFRADLAADAAQFTPKQIANALSDIRWTKTTDGGQQVSMWPGKAAMLGTLWEGKYYVGQRDEPEPQPPRPPVEISDTNLVEMADEALRAEAERNSALLSELNEQGRPSTDNDVMGLVNRQLAIGTERNRRIEVARRELIPDGEDVEYGELRAGDTVVVPFITDRGPEVATITSAVGNEVRIRYDDGTERSFLMVGGIAAAKWRRGEVATSETVTTGDLKVGDRLILEGGGTARVDAIRPGDGDRVTLEVTDDSGQQRDIEADRYGSHVRVATDDPAVTRPDVADMSDDELFIEAVENSTAGADTSPDHPLSARQQAIYAEQRRRVQAAQRDEPVRVSEVSLATARPRLYTYQRKNLVALNLDTVGADAPGNVKQAAARVRARMPLTEDQSRELADYLRELAEQPGTRVQRARSLRRLAAAFDTSAAVAAGRRENAPQPGNDRVQRVRSTGLTAGDTAVIRGADGRLVTARIQDVQAMMRGTLARVTIEHEDGSIETRILDRDADVWLMPDLPPDKPGAVDEPDGPAVELTYSEDLRVGDTIAYMRGGEYLEGVIERIETTNDGRRVELAGGHVTFTSDGEMRTRIARGPETTDQPYLYTVNLLQRPEQVTGLEVRPGDRIAVNLYDPPTRGTVLTVEEADGEGGVRGRLVTFSDDTGAVLSVMLFEDMSVSRLARGADNAAESIRQAMEDRRRREAENDVIAALERIQNHSMTRAAGHAHDIAVGSGRAAVIREIEGLSETWSIQGRIQLENSLGSARANREAMETLAKQLAEDARQRLIRSVQEAEPLDGETETDMLRRVLMQHMTTPPGRQNRAIARSLLRATALLGDTQAGDRPAAPVVAEGDLSARMQSYRQALGGRFGHVNTRRATFGTLDFDALERGEEPQITYKDQFARDTAADGGPGETTMRHLEILRAAGADLDANLQQQIADRMRRDGLDLPEEAQGNPSAYMQQLEDLSASLAKARSKVFSDMLKRGIAAEQKETLSAEFERLGDEYKAAVAKLDPLRRSFANAQRVAARDLLAKVRQMGGVRLDYQQADPQSGRNRYTTGAGRYLGERDQNVRAMRTAEDVLPADWLNSIRDHVKTAYRRSHIGLSSVTRGHADYRGNIRLSEVGGPFFDGDPGRGQVAVHELGHFAERAVPGILAAENAFLWSRTSSGQVGTRDREQMVNMAGIGGDRSQYGFKDDFRHPYTGVDYKASRGGDTEAFEILTTGVESLYAGSKYMDEDMRRWLLGTLALL